MGNHRDLGAPAVPYALGRACGLDLASRMVAIRLPTVGSERRLGHVVATWLLAGQEVFTQLCLAPETQARPALLDANPTHTPECCRHRASDLGGARHAAGWQAHDQQGV